MKPTRILMVCLGNICRSPLAEGILRKQLNDPNITVDSAGTAAYHVNSPPDYRSIAVAKSNGIDISQLCGAVFTIKHFDDFTHIFVMDNQNYADVISKARNAEDIAKVSLILKNAEVPDPYYGDLKDFEHIFNLLYDACQKIVKQITD